MSINFNCPNRIKPVFLREKKTEALLVFIRTTLEQHFKLINTQGIEISDFGSKEDTEYIYEQLNNLLDNLKETVVNSSYLISVIENSGKSKIFNLLAQKEKPMMVYYDSIVKAMEKNLPQGNKWIPEQLVLNLLSHWVLEEEKSTYLYPYLRNLDYITLLSVFDKVKLQESVEKKEIVMNMYNLSMELIEVLKDTSYKTASKKSKKKRRK